MSFQPVHITCKIVGRQSSTLSRELPSLGARRWNDPAMIDLCFHSKWQVWSLMLLFVSIWFHLGKISNWLILKGRCHETHYRERHLWFSSFQSLICLDFVQWWAPSNYTPVQKGRRYEWNRLVNVRCYDQTFWILESVWFIWLCCAFSTKLNWVIRTMQRAYTRPKM